MDRRTSIISSKKFLNENFEFFIALRSCISWHADAS